MAQLSTDGELKLGSSEGALLLARLRRLARKKTGRRLSALPACNAVVNGNHPSPEIRAFFDGLPSDDKHHWIATYDALLMPQKKRRKLAAYFTPPQLAKYAIDKLRGLGVHPGTSKILDPSSGGAAFLVPLAEAIALDARKRRLDPRATLDKIHETIAGIEIDKSLIRLSELLLADLLAEELSKRWPSWPCRSLLKGVQHQVSPSCRTQKPSRARDRPNPFCDYGLASFWIRLPLYKEGRLEWVLHPAVMYRPRVLLSCRTGRTAHDKTKPVHNGVRCIPGS